MGYSCAPFSAKLRTVLRMNLTPYKTGWRVQVYRLGVRKSKTFATKSEAKAWGRQMEVEIDGKPESTHRFFDACDKYLADISSMKDGAKWEKLRIEAFKAHFGDMLLSDMQQPQMSAWRDMRVREVTGGTVRREKTLLNHIFTVARQEWHWSTHRPFEGVRMPPDNELREQTWKWQQIKRVLRAPTTGKTREVVDAFHIALRTAMRLQEALAAPELFDKERQVVVLPPEIDKMKRTRVVPIGRIAAKLLQREPFVVEPNEASTLFADLLACLGIKGMMFRDSRATALTLLARKVDVMRLQKISGHKDVRMLSRYYRESAEDISRRI